MGGSGTSHGCLAIGTSLSLVPQQLRQLGDVRRNALPRILVRLLTVKSTLIRSVYWCYGHAAVRGA